MELPKLDRATYTIKIDSVELILTEPTLEQAEKMDSIKSSDEENVINKVAEVLAELMDSYTETREEKIKFIKGLSYRQLFTIESELTKLATQKKVPAESEKSTSR